MGIAELIATLEAATGPDRELDAEIAMQNVSLLRDLPRTEAGGWTHPEWGKIAPASEYTASLDAALTLIPQDYGWCVSGGYNWQHGHAEVGKHKALGATPALALCIAAMKARA